MNVHVPSQYLSRSKARDFFGGYNAIPAVVRNTLNDLFESEGQPRIVKLINNHPALLFDRNPTRPRQVLIKDEKLYGRFYVDENLAITTGWEFLEHSDSKWRKPN